MSANICKGLSNLDPIRMKCWENLTRKSYRLSTSPVRCSHCTLGNPEKVIFNSISHTYYWLFTLSHKKTICNSLAYTPPKNVTTLTCELQNFFIWLKVCCVFQTLEALKRASCGLSSVAVKRTGCDVWQLECQASNVTPSVQSDHLLH